VISLYLPAWNLVSDICIRQQLWHLARNRNDSEAGLTFLFHTAKRKLTFEPGTRKSGERRADHAALIEELSCQLIRNPSETG